jgi:hypothetical protein
MKAPHAHGMGKSKLASMPHNPDKRGAQSMSHNPPKAVPVPTSRKQQPPDPWARKPVPGSR